MTSSQPSPEPDGEPQRPSTDSETPARIALSEDWLATIVGLVLIALILVGIVPEGAIP